MAVDSSPPALLGGRRARCAGALPPRLGPDTELALVAVFGLSAKNHGIAKKLIPNEISGADERI